MKNESIQVNTNKYVYSKENIIPKNFIEYDVITDLNIIKELIKYENEK